MSNRKSDFLRLTTVALLSTATLAGCAMQGKPAGEKFAEIAVKDIGLAWSDSVLDSYVDRDFRRHNSKAWDQAFMKSAAENLGAFKKITNTPTSQPLPANATDGMSLNVTVEAEYEKGPANVTVVIDEHEGRWGISQFHVNSAKFSDAIAYADRAFQEIGADWDEKKLDEFAGPEFYRNCPRPRAVEICKILKDNLGQLKNFKGSTLQTLQGSPIGTGQTSIKAEGDFEKGAANVTLAVSFHDDSWFLSGFSVQSPALKNVKPPENPNAPHMPPPGQIPPGLLPPGHPLMRGPSGTPIPGQTQVLPGVKPPLTPPPGVPVSEKPPVATPEIPLPPSDMRTPGAPPTP